VRGGWIAKIFIKLVVLKLLLKSTEELAILIEIKGP